MVLHGREDEYQDMMTEQTVIKAKSRVRKAGSNIPVLTEATHLARLIVCGAVSCNGYLQQSA